MNLTIAELAQLPLAAALLDSDGAVLAHTPEWTGAGAARATYRVRNRRLLVADENCEAGSEPLVDALLRALQEASLQAGGVTALQVRMLETSLRALVGRTLEGEGGSDRVVHFASAGIAGRTGLEVHIDDHAAWTLRAPEVAALALVQLAVNAERHGGARAVALQQSTRAFHVRWSGQRRAGSVRTARRRDDRRRWGLGFARIAADALGGSLYPRLDEDGGSVSTLDLGAIRLALPLAAVRRGVVVKATSAWDEETGSGPGTHIASDARIASCVELAHAAPGAVVEHSGWQARDSGEVVWLAVPPDGMLDRARDLVDGLAHERALWDGIAEPQRSRVAGLATLLGAALGAPLPRAPAVAWTVRMREIAPLFGLGMQVPECPALGALDPQVTALLAAEVGSGFRVDGERMWLELRAGAGGNPLLSALPEAQRGLVALT